VQTSFALESGARDLTRRVQQATPFVRWQRGLNSVQTPRPIIRSLSASLRILTLTAITMVLQRSSATTTCTVSARRWRRMSGRALLRYLLPRRCWGVAECSKATVNAVCTRIGM